MRLRSVLILGVAILLPGTATGQNHEAFTSLLSKYVHPDGSGLNVVDYEGWRSNPDDRDALDSYIARLEETPVSTLPDAERFALWANLYNAVTVKLILDEKPKKSIREIRPHSFAFGPWGANRVTVEGENLSLDNIEHDILRKQWDDPRIHYAVNCASIGCPNLPTKAWEASTLEQDLDAAARDYINHPRGVTTTDRGLRVSKIYKWYREDFGDSDEGVIQHILEYADSELAESIRVTPKIRGHEYDWDLNRFEPSP
ncbi:MAG: DUF547 domain-containing protein [Rhodothermia bacterium]|nr:DUF547 domain-containing protein [Rhodothermia bacterium]